MNLPSYAETLVCACKETIDKRPATSAVAKTLLPGILEFFVMAFSFVVPHFDLAPHGVFLPVLPRGAGHRAFVMLPRAGLTERRSCESRSFSKSTHLRRSHCCSSRHT